MSKFKRYKYEINYMNVCFDFYSGHVYALNFEGALTAAWDHVHKELTYIKLNLINIDIDLDIDHIKIFESEGA